MNQILSIENSTKKNSGPVEIGKVIKFFGIVLIIFGVFMIGSGSYSMYKGTKKEERNTNKTNNWN